MHQIKPWASEQIGARPNPARSHSLRSFPSSGSGSGSHDCGAGTDDRTGGCARSHPWPHACCHHSFGCRRRHRRLHVSLKHRPVLLPESVQ